MNQVKSILRLAIPLYLEMLFATLLSTIDTVMLSNYDELAVTAVGNAFSILGFLTVLFSISSVGVSIVVSQYLGAGKKEDSKKVLSQGVIFNFSFALLITLVIIFFNKQILLLANTPKELLDGSSTYLKMIAYTLPFQALSLVQSANLKANGKPIYSTIVSLFVNILNVILNYIFIYGKIGLPSLGLKGAALATMICHIVVFITNTILSKKVLNQNIFKLEFHKKEMDAIIKLGGPSAFENICYNIAQFIVLSQVNLLLTEFITARTYINTILAYIYMLSGAFGNANSILVGYAVGKKDFDEARKVTKLSFSICYPIVLIIVSLLNLCYKPIFSIFTKNNDIIQIIALVMPIIFLLETGRCSNLIVINALKSSGDVFFPVICAVFSMFLVSGGGSILSTQYLNLGLIGIFLCNALDELIRALLTVIRWKSNKWTTKYLKN